MSKRNKKKDGFKKLKAETFNKKKLKNSIITILYGDPSKTVNYKQISIWLTIEN